MRLLLDTHAFLWYVSNDPRLSQLAETALSSPGNALYVSVGSFWEMAIKLSLGKLKLAKPLADFVEEQCALNGIETLDLTLNHLAHLASLPFHHRDPFDRLLVAQSIEERMDLVSVDTALDAYTGVRRLW